MLELVLLFLVKAHFDSTNYCIAHFTLSLLPFPPSSLSNIPVVGHPGEIQQGHPLVLRVEEDVGKDGSAAHAHEECHRHVEEDGKGLHTPVHGDGEGRKLHAHNVADRVLLLLGRHVDASRKMYTDV